MIAATRQGRRFADIELVYYEERIESAGCATATARS